MTSAELQHQIVSRAFGAQSVHYDKTDRENPVLQEWRNVVYNHLKRFLEPKSSILELNAGTGIDSVQLAKWGHRITATDISSGMIDRMTEKVSNENLTNQITVHQAAFEDLSGLDGQRFNHVFSNFGGLNCAANLNTITRQLPALLCPVAFVTWVIMPPFSPWEALWMLKGDFRNGVRRWRNESQARLEDETFMTYYHTVSRIKEAFGRSFRLVALESLGVVSPPPGASGFVQKYPSLTRHLQRIENNLRNVFPFNQWGDHIIATFAYRAK